MTDSRWRRHPAIGAGAEQPPHVDPATWARFVRWVVPIPGGCHIWIGEPREDGYGQFQCRYTKEDPTAEHIHDAGAPPTSRREPTELLDLFGDQHAPSEPPAPKVQKAAAEPWRTWRAHRLSYWAWNGYLPDVVRHECDQPLCCPITAEHARLHLADGDRVSNAADRDSRGRGSHPGRNGVMWWGNADRRGAYARSVAIRRHLTDALAGGTNLAELPRALAAAELDGDPWRAQMLLPLLDTD